MLHVPTESIRPVAADRKHLIVTLISLNPARISLCLTESTAWNAKHAQSARRQTLFFLSLRVGEALMKEIRSCPGSTDASIAVYLGATDKYRFKLMTLRLNGCLHNTLKRLIPGRASPIIRRLMDNSETFMVPCGEGVQIAYVSSFSLTHQQHVLISIVKRVASVRNQFSNDVLSR